jgi:Trk-type K+ transport system membrane component
MRKKSWIHLSAPRWIAIIYLLVRISRTLLLLLPVSLQPGVRLSFINSLFTSASAVSVTGLTTVSTANTFSLFGTAVLLVGFQLGGLGVMAIGSFYWLLLGQSSGLWQRKLIMLDQNRYNLSGIVQVIKLILGLTLLFEGISAILFGAYFYAAGYTPTLSKALYYGVFHSISAYTNAGFDLFGNSMINYAHDYIVQALTMILIVLGAIGFPVLVEIMTYVQQRRTTPRFRFS